MSFPTREAALQDVINAVSESLGATTQTILIAPTPTQNAPYLVSFEVPQAGGLVALHVALIDSGGIALPGGGAEYTAEVETGPVLLGEGVLAGSLEQIEQGGEIPLDGISYVADQGFEDRYPLSFETPEGVENVALLVNGAYRPGFVSPNVFEDRDVVLADYGVDDPQGSPRDDAVELAEGVTYRGYKGDDTILIQGEATVFGGSGEDIIQALGGGDNVINGNQNDDRIYSGRGEDIVDGGTGDDWIFMGGTGEGFGGKGNDQLDARHGDGVNLYGGQGEDRLIGGGVSETHYGGDGADFISAGYQADSDAGDLIYAGKGNDSVSGSDGNDTVFGGNGKDFIRAWTGNDELRGGGSNDTIEGGYGEDQLYGGDGNDVLRGGKHADTIYGGNNNDIIYTEDDTGGRSNEPGDVAYGGAGSDALYGGRTADALFGGKGADFLDGDRGDDTLDGGADRDVLQGALGNDSLNGGDGKDDLYGGSGDDILRGGHGDDTLTGGEGKDIFGFGNDGSADVVTDFHTGHDTIELVGFDDLSFDDLFLSQDDSAAMIAAGDVTIRLENVDSDDLEEADFIF